MARPKELDDDVYAEGRERRETALATAKENTQRAQGRLDTAVELRDTASQSNPSAWPALQENVHKSEDNLAACQKQEATCAQDLKNYKEKYWVNTQDYDRDQRNEQRQDQRQEQKGEQQAELKATRSDESPGKVDSYWAGGFAIGLTVASTLSPYFDRENQSQSLEPKTKIEHVQSGEQTQTKPGDQQTKQAAGEEGKNIEAQGRGQTADASGQAGKTSETHAQQAPDHSGTASHAHHEPQGTEPPTKEGHASHGAPPTEQSVKPGHEGRGQDGRGPESQAESTHAGQDHAARGIQAHRGAPEAEHRADESPRRQGHETQPHHPHEAQHHHQPSGEQQRQSTQGQPQAGQHGDQEHAGDTGSQPPRHGDQHRAGDSHSQSAHDGEQHHGGGSQPHPHPDGETKPQRGHEGQQLNASDGQAYHERGATQPAQGGPPESKNAPGGGHQPGGQGHSPNGDGPKPDQGSTKGKPENPGERANENLTDLYDGMKKQGEQKRERNDASLPNPDRSAKDIASSSPPQREQQPAQERDR